MAEASGASGYGVRITRVFDAPRDRVWKEWTEPERFAPLVVHAVALRAGSAAPPPRGLRTA